MHPVSEWAPCFRAAYPVSEWVCFRAGTPYFRAGIPCFRAGTLDQVVALNATRYLRTSERDYLPWASALAALRYVGDMLSKSGAYEAYLVRPGES